MKPRATKNEVPPGLSRATNGPEMTGDFGLSPLQWISFLVARHFSAGTTTTTFPQSALTPRSPSRAERALSPSAPLPGYPLGPGRGEDGLSPFQWISPCQPGDSAPGPAAGNHVGTHCKGRIPASHDARDLADKMSARSFWLPAMMLHATTLIVRCEESALEV